MDIDAMDAVLINVWSDKPIGKLNLSDKIFILPKLVCATGVG